MVNIKEAKKLPINELVVLLKQLSDAYYNTGHPLVSDAVYDELIDILKKKDPHNKFLQEIGYEPHGKKNKVTLPYSMGSLSKIKPETGELEKWKQQYVGDYVISDKLDGISAQLYKDNNGNVFLYSRGKKNIGQDISHLLVYLKINYTNLPNDTSIRGELIINKEDFKQIADEMENARNAVAGLVNSKHVDRKVANITQYVCYNVLHPEYLQTEQMKLLKEWGFKVVTYKIVKDITEESLIEYLKERREQSEFEIDGIVCFDNSMIHHLAEGTPEYGFAFKMIFDEQIEIVKVVKILWNVSKDGYIKPIVEIEPIRIGGTTITYATGHNAKFIVDNKLGPDAVIKIIRSGDVIPYVLDIIKPAKEPQMPDIKYKWNETKVDIIADEETDSMNMKILQHFFKTMGIKYIGEGVVKKLYDNGYTSILKILTANENDLMNIEGLGFDSINRIFEEIDKSFDNVSLPIFMYASHKFGRGLGEKKLYEIIKVYPNILIVDWSDEEMYNKILEINGFSEKLATLFIKNFHKFKKFYNKIKVLKDISRFEKEKTNKTKKVKKDIFEDMIIVFTGFRDKDLEKFITDNGGKVTTSVSKKTTLIIRGDDESSSKIEKGKELGIEIVTKKKFMEAINK